MPKKIVILGAGFGGVKAAFQLSRLLHKNRLEEKYRLILTDKNPYHTYYPTLYEVATTSKVLANLIDLERIVAFPLAKIFRGRAITLLQKAVENLDLLGGDIHLDGGEKLKFDYLVLAPGSEVNYFDIPGLKEYSLTLKSFKDALMIRDAIWSQAEQIRKNRKIRIIIGGGGSTGVELAGEIRSWICQLQEEFSGCNSEIGIVEAGPTVLAGFDSRVVKKATQRLQKIGVSLLTGEIIEKVDSRQVFLKSQKKLDYDVLIWTGGVKAASVIATLPLKKEKRGRAEVASGMECLPQTENLKLYGKIYGLGDAVCFYDPETQKPIPQLAEAAIEQAGVVAHNVMQDIKLEEGLIKEAIYKKYFPRKNYPFIIPVGGKYAIAKIGSWVIGGFWGWVLKGLVELYYLLFNVLPPLQAIRIWLKGLWIFMKNDRLG